jgi:hypothetical protein
MVWPDFDRFIAARRALLDERPAAAKRDTPIIPLEHFHPDWNLGLANPS